MRPLVLLLVACSSAPEGGGALPPADRAIRASMALRGVRPSPEELAAVREDPGALPDLVDLWLDDPAFDETVKDLHAESLWLRTDGQPSLPAIGPLQGEARGTIQASVAEAPLELVARIVAEGRPYGEVLTTHETMVDPILATAYGLAWDPEGPEWQVAAWTDGRPAAGLLTENGVWLRHISSDTNLHRTRAAAVMRAFTCDDLAGRDLGILGLDLADPAAVGDAVRDDPACAGCHEVLDPVASTFSGYKRYIGTFEIVGAYAAGCPDPDFCYPLGLFDPEEAGGWAEQGLPEPSWFGEPTPDLAALARAVVQDPAFDRCAARRFSAWLTQTEPELVDEATLDDLVAAYEIAGDDARALAKAAVLEPGFLSDAWPRQVARPEQYARMLEDLTGFRWVVDPDPAGCAAAVPTCWGPVDLLNNDRFGFRLVAGGIDGYEVRHPIHELTPTRVLVFEEAATQAAGFVAADDLGRPAAERRLLGLVERDTSAPDAVKAQLAWLHDRILGEQVDADGPAVGSTFELWSAAMARHGDPERAWALVLTALLSDPRAVTF